MPSDATQRAVGSVAELQQLFIDRGLETREKGGTGFQVTTPNGWTFSIQSGPYHYRTGRNIYEHFEPGEIEALRDHWFQCFDAEIAIWSDVDHQMRTMPGWSENVNGWMPVGDILELFDSIATGETVPPPFDEEQDAKVRSFFNREVLVEKEVPPMTDTQRRAVEAIDSWFKSSYKNLGYGNEILARVRAADLVIVSRADVEGALDAMQYVKDTYFWDKHGYQATEDALKGALGDE